jgi:hypothetical protein
MPTDIHSIRSTDPRETLVDMLDLRHTIIAEGLLLDRDADASWVLHTVAAGRARPLGRFANVRDAWLAIDALDVPAVAA